MADIFKLICCAVIGLFRSRASLEAEILTLRQQLNVLRRKSPKRLAFSNVDRLIFAGLYQITPRVLNALTIVEPETVIRWHRAGFRLFWRWKSRCRSGRPRVALEIRQLIRDMSLADPLWGAPRIHGELLKLGIDVGQTSVAKYMARQTLARLEDALRTMLMESLQSTCLSFHNLISAVWLVDFARPTPDVMAGVTAHPTAEWIAHNSPRLAVGKMPQYLIRDRDGLWAILHGALAPGIRDRRPRRDRPGRTDNVNG
jgi:hypothetical protein